MNTTDIIFLIVGFPLFFCAIYRFIFLLIFLLKRDRNILKNAPKNRFVIIIPAHNESSCIEATLVNFQKQNYPKSLYDIVVIADNCNDETYKKAIPLADEVYQRNNQKFIGKGYAIKWVLEQLELNQYEVVVITDADTLLGENFLSEMNNSFLFGSRVVQSYYGMSNPGKNLFTHFFFITNTIRNLFCFWAKWKAGLSVPLVGSGMCFSVSILKKYKWTAFSITEDHEYYAFLAQNGIRVDFCPTARVFTQHTTNIRQATSQRLRWYGGKYLSIYRYGVKLVFDGITSSSLLKLDAGFELVMPHMALLLNLNLIGMLFWILLRNYLSNVPLIALSVLLLVQILYFMVGIITAKSILKSIKSLFLVPIILLWGLLIDFLALTGLRRKQWVRTERNV
jgi:cellulose synthase/poly-beta-1,6-N-acetylglucosamine synthase-like glycosyltransferase